MIGYGLMCMELLTAARRGDAERVKKLLFKGIDARYHRSIWNGPETALRFACENGDVEIVKLLLEHGGETQEELIGSFCGATKQDRVEILKILLERGVDPSSSDNLAVLSAANCGSYDSMKLLLEDPRVDPSTNDNLAISYAARSGYYNIMELLLKHPSVDGTNAISCMNRRIVFLLLEDERCGIHVNRSLFENHHPKEVEEYDRLTNEREAQKWAALWCMKENNGEWKDIMWPFGNRFEKYDLSGFIDLYLFKTDIPFQDVGYDNFE